MKICLILCLVALTWLQYVHSAVLTCANPNQLRDIYNVIGLWNADSVAKNLKTTKMFSLPGRHTKQTFRLDSETPTADNFAKFRIQSGKLTYADVLVKIGITFRATKIRAAFVNSAKNCRIVRLERLGLYYSVSDDGDETYEELDEEDLTDDEQGQEEDLTDNEQGQEEDLTDNEQGQEDDLTDNEQGQEDLIDNEKVN